MVIKDAIKHFIAFHKGFVNIALHLIGFFGVFYSIYKSDWILFAVAFVVLEAGHLYNHIIGKTKYDFRLKTIFWRLVIFLIVIAAFYFFKVKTTSIYR